MRPRHRWVLLSVLVLACAPYIGLKVLWLTGSAVGVREPGLMQTPVYVVANLVTLLMDTFLIVVVAALTRPPGASGIRRWLVVPAVLGLGLLFPVATGAPLLGLVELLAASPGAPADQGLAPWMFAVVYSGFTVQFLVLTVAVAAWLRYRPAGFGGAIGTADRRRMLAPSLVAVAAGGVYCGGLLGWAAGLTVGLAGGEAMVRTGRVFDGLLAALAVVAAALSTAVARRAASLPTMVARGAAALPTVALIVATSVWTWAVYLLLVSFAAPGGERTFTPIGTVVWCCGVVAGAGAAWRTLAADDLATRLVGRPATPVRRNDRAAEAL